jgi:hypothetical protein
MLRALAGGRGWRMRGLAVVVMAHGSVLAAEPIAARPGAADVRVTPARPTMGAPIPLPRLFTVEQRQDGSLYADGARLSAASDLPEIARRAASQGGFAGAAVFAERAPDRRRLVELLTRQGFADVRSADRPAPRELGVRVGSKPAPPAPRPPRATDLPAPASARPSAVQLTTVGLHVGGAPADEKNRRRLVKLFENEFGAFRRCHAKAKDRKTPAIFGVDLLIPKVGGKATVRETRTRLDGDGFLACMRRVLGEISFHAPPTGRPEMVSYSLSFKPVQR